MFFRNLTFFRFPARTVGGSYDQFDNALGECALKPVGSLEFMSRGFVSPYGRGGVGLSHRVGPAVWITLGGEDKILPSSVIDEAVAKRVAAIEEQEGRKLGGRARKRVIEDVVAQLLPQAFVQPSRLNAYLDLRRGFIAIDTASRKQAEALVTELRHALGSFPALPLNAEASPRTVMTGWISGEPMATGFALGEECELKDPIDGGAMVKCQRQELLGEEIVKHLEAGKQACKLALVFDDHVSFVLGEDLELRKVKFLDGVVDALDQGDAPDSLAAELEARFALMSGEVGRLFDALERVLRLSSPTTEPAGGSEQSEAEPGTGARTAKYGNVTVTATPVPASIHQQDADPLYDQAVAHVRQSGRVSISGVQRVLQIGYNRAARLIERMEEDGVVSPQNNAGERTVLAATPA